MFMSRCGISRQKVILILSKLLDEKNYKNPPNVFRVNNPFSNLGIIISMGFLLQKLQNSILIFTMVRSCLDHAKQI